MRISGALGGKPRSFSALSSLHSPQTCKMSHNQQHFIEGRRDEAFFFSQPVKFKLSGVASRVNTQSFNGKKCLVMAMNSLFLFLQVSSGEKSRKCGMVDSMSTYMTGGI